MKLNKDQLTAMGTGTSVSFFTKDETPVFAGTHSNGGTVLHLGPLTIFFDGDHDMELVNLLLDQRKRQGKDTI